MSDKISDLKDEKTRREIADAVRQAWIQLGGEPPSMKTLLKGIKIRKAKKIINIDENVEVEFSKDKT